MFIFLSFILSLFFFFFFFNDTATTEIYTLSLHDALPISKPKVAGKVTQKELAVFTRQFSVMIDAGLPLVQCLEILGGQQENRVFQKILFEVRQDVESGATLADSLKKHPKAFTDLYVNMVAAGEAGGILDTILRRL